MGLYADGFDPLVLDSRALAVEMRGAVEAWFDGHIQIIDPAIPRRARGVYDPVTDAWSGDAIPLSDAPDPSILWDSGERGALVQPIRSQTVGDFGAQAIGLVGVRLQAAIPDEVDLRSGLQIRVLDGGADTEVTRHLYVLGSGIDSSLRWVTRLMAMVTTSG